MFIERCHFHSGTYLCEPRNTGCLLSLVGDSCRHSNSFDESLPSWPCTNNSFSDNFIHLLGTSTDSERRGVMVTNSGVSIFTLSQGFDCFGGLVVSMLASGTQVCGFKPGRSRWIFTGVKILSMPSSGGEVKESVPCPSFAAYQRT